MAEHGTWYDEILVVRLFRARVSRLFAVVLLLWTAADLLNTNLCAADQGPMISIGGPAALSVPDGPSPRPPAGSEADCFCCAQTLQLFTVSTVAPLLLVVDGANALALKVPLQISVPLDHPPQTLLSSAHPG